MKHVLMLAMLAFVGICLLGCATEELPTVDMSVTEPDEPPTFLEVGDTECLVIKLKLSSSIGSYTNAENWYLLTL